MIFISIRQIKSLSNKPFYIHSIAPFLVLWSFKFYKLFWKWNKIGFSLTGLDKDHSRCKLFPVPTKDYHPNTELLCSGKPILLPHSELKVENGCISIHVQRCCGEPIELYLCHALEPNCSTLLLWKQTRLIKSPEI